MPVEITEEFRSFLREVLGDMYEEFIRALDRKLSIKGISVRAEIILDSNGYAIPIIRVMNPGKFHEKWRISREVRDILNEVSENFGKEVHRMVAVIAD